MKKLLVILIVATMVFAATNAFAANEVKTKIGALTIGATFKAGLNYYIGDEYLSGGQAMDRESDMTFTINTFLVKFGGWVLDERVTYLAIIFAKDGSFNAITGVDDEDNPVMGSYKDNQGLQVLDMKLGFHYIPYTGIYVGHMLPAMTYFNNLPAHFFKTIEQPLMNTYVFPRTRQTGLNFGLVSPYIEANLGIYNGRQFMPARAPVGARLPMGNTTYVDQNTAKDIHFGVIGKPPVDGLKVRANLWYGMPVDEFENDEGELIAYNATVMFINAGVDYLAPFGLTAVFDLLYGTYAWESTLPPFVDTADRDDDTFDLTTMSYYLMAAYNFGPLFEVPVEVLLRYDYLDPDTLNDEDLGLGYKDALTDITAGVNYYIEGYNAMLSLNYIYHGEEWEEITNKAGDDTQDGISNDTIKLQAQVAF